ncbi:hypothetical protein [Streptomyces sp. NPDC098781]|uniref:hypothetical protein n=1 Tax=Streptomyces sp. NPDC098781 TaxID=3366097 RepID=UPI00382EFF92
MYVDRRSSIEETARLLAVGKGRLRRLLVEHCIAIRPAGQNAAAGRRARVQPDDRAAADRRVGAQDITARLHNEPPRAPHSAN